MKVTDIMDISAYRGILILLYQILTHYLELRGALTSTPRLSKDELIGIPVAELNRHVGELHAAVRLLDNPNA